jgi:ankyrin repeat protein
MRKEGVMDSRADGVARLLSHSSRNETAQVKAIIENEKFSPDTADYDKRTSLHLACAEGAYETVSRLCDVVQSGSRTVVRAGGISGRRGWR